MGTSEKIKFYLDEITKCKNSFHYYCENYVYIDVAGGSIKLKEYNRQRELIDDLQKSKFLVVLKSRQIGISTIIQAYVSWLLTFHDNVIVGVVSKDGPEATDFSRKIMSIIEQQPVWMRRKFKKRAEQSFILDNKSAVYTATVAPNAPDKCLRGKAITFLVIDEAAFIRKVEEAWTSMVPALSTSQKHAKRAGVPYGTIVLSTPNKTMGVGKWYYQTYTRAIENKSKSIKEVGVFSPFVIHWKQISELADDPDWYRTQCNLFDNDPKKIQQELELKFLPAGGSFFNTNTCTSIQDNTSDEKVNKSILKLPGGDLWLFKKPIPGKHYLVGVDTAGEYGDDKSAVEVYDYETMEQVAEYVGKCQPKIFAENVVSEIVRLYHGTVVVESNSYGTQILNHLTSTELIEYVYYEKSGEIRKSGLSTNLKTRPLMIDSLYSFISEYPETIKSDRLALELIGLVEKTNGRVEADSGCHDDMAMAAAFCYYVRKYDPPLAVSMSQEHSDVLDMISKMNSDVTHELKHTRNENIFSTYKNFETENSEVSTLDLMNFNNIY